MFSAMTIETTFREATAEEQALLSRLLEASFPGRDELAALLSSVLVKSIDEDGGLELQSKIAGEATVVKRVPVEAEAKDEDGTVIHMLLHVVKGRPVELEFYRDGLGTVERIPPPAAFELIVLPPMPTNSYFNRS
jgi:hypothetical protein